LIDYAKANPGRVSFASAGNGSVSHLAGELFKMHTKTDLVHVPYKGGGAAMPDVIGGRVSIMFETSTNALAAARGGRVRALAVTGIERWKPAPELPTIAEAGVPGGVAVIVSAGALATALVRRRPGAALPRLETAVLLGVLAAGAAAAATWFPLQRPITAVPLLLAAGRSWRLSAEASPDSSPE